MSPFLTLPPELHSHIAYLACLADTGPTILSLSQVSKYLNGVSCPYLFHTVSVAGPHRISLLSSALQKYVSSPRPVGGAPVGNLYLGMNQLPSLSERVGLVSTVSRILALSSTSLRTLTIDFSGAMQESPLLFSRVFRTSFPKLEDLTLIGFYPNPTIPSPPSSRRPSVPPSPTTSTAKSPSSPTPLLNSLEGERATNFPNVKRLHLSGNRGPSGLFSVGSIASVFPSLEELKVSGLSMAVGFANEVEEALRQSSSMSSLSTQGSSTQVADGPGETARSVSFADIGTSPGPFPLPSPTRFIFAPRLPAKIRLLQLQPAPAMEPSIGPMPNTTEIVKDENMMGLLRGVEATYNGDGGERVDGVRFELLGRGSVEFEEVWEAWRGGLRG
ncbi:hypothetical protein FA13DRAFT_1736613 [Coprinellus micaceus]|uniref:Uncharacterized protein n=1 Tax=Coprinellus micaceus TaxID=71717 RepID=A0A4Y7T1G6_COPMI|nr:hypothetical protein FA13DRAFT_1736613 [Coprinellus micaceus]